ncbi:MAG: tetratricopeptide repeat protein [Elusimicrobia bacterium]|nr:tetratricopeptide repeat protein [Candidatus Obscuribacterium magneticum]
MTFQSFTKSTIAPYLILTLFGFLSFGPALRVGFLWDDHEMIENNQHIKKLTVENLKYIFTHDAFDGKGDPYYRPLQTLFNMGDYHIWKLNPFGYHLTNFFLHILNVCLLFFCLKRLLRSPPLAFLTSLFFSLHPINVEQQLIIAGRAELMALAFGFLSWALVMQKTVRGLWGALFFYVLACLSKETGIVFPIFMFLGGLLNGNFRWPWKTYLLFGFLAAIYLSMRFSLIPYDVSTPSLHDLILFFTRDLPTILITYMRILVFPTDLHSHRRMLFVKPLMYISPTLLLMALLWASFKKSRVVWFSMGWFMMGLLPKMPILATNSLMLDHWAYISGIGVYLIIAQGLLFLLKRGGKASGMGIALTGGILLFWMGMTWGNIRNRNTDKKMYEWALRHPTSSHVRYNLGLIYYQEGKYMEAKRLFEESLRINPDNLVTANGLALTLWKLGEKNEAVQTLSTWIERKPGHAQSYINRAILLRGQKGLADINKALGINPRHERAWLIKAGLLYEAGLKIGSIEAYKKALQINPTNDKALCDVGTLYQELGDIPTATQYWTEALSINPNNPLAKENLKRWSALK